jgi:hypothetical protein
VDSLLKALEQLIPDPQLRSVVIGIGFVVVALWWVRSKEDNETTDRAKSVDKAIENLYGPGHALVRAFLGGALAEPEYRTQMRNLLVTHSHLALQDPAYRSDLFRAINNWLWNRPGLKTADLEADMLNEFSLALTNASVNAHERRGFIPRLLRAVGWLTSTALMMSGLVMLLGSILAVIVALTRSGVTRSATPSRITPISFGLVLVVAVALVFWAFYAVRQTFKRQREAARLAAEERLSTDPKGGGKQPKKPTARP